MNKWKHTYNLYIFLECLDGGMKSSPYSYEIPIIMANVQDEESLLQMAASSRVLINCVGPVRGRMVIYICLSMLVPILRGGRCFCLHLSKDPLC